MKAKLNGVEYDIDQFLVDGSDGTIILSKDNQIIKKTHFGLLNELVIIDDINHIIPPFFDQKFNFPTTIPADPITILIYEHAIRCNIARLPHEHVYKHYIFKQDYYGMLYTVLCDIFVPTYVWNHSNVNLVYKQILMLVSMIIYIHTQKQFKLDDCFNFLNQRNDTSTNSINNLVKSLVYHFLPKFHPQQEITH
jgi:hypothetical protein